MAAKHRAPTVCVFGGTGFVGRAIVSALIDRGYRVRVPTRNPERHRDLWVLPGVELPVVDVRDDAAIGDVLTGCDAALNLIGILNETGRAEGAQFERVHAELPAKIVRACNAAGVERLLHMSALKADAHDGPSVYLRSKGRGEDAVKQLAERVRWTIFRPSVIFGPDDTFTNRFAGLIASSPVLPLPSPGARFAPVYVEDVAAAFRTALERRDTDSRTYELCGPDLYSLEEIVGLIRLTLGKRRCVVPLGDAAGRLLARIGEYLPGKPLTLDNYRSMTVASVCSENGFAALGIAPQALATILPTYLGSSARQRRLTALRRSLR